MVHFERLAATIVLTLALCCCAGPSPSPRPTSSPTIQPTTTPELTPSAAPATLTPETPTPTTATTPTETPGTPTPTPSQPSGTPVPIGWLERTDVLAGPSAREDHTWTVDPQSGIAYLFAGRTADGASNELWAFDMPSDAWSMRQPTGAVPARRFGHTATWVPDVGLVVWSGQGDSGFFDDIWAYDPVTNAWMELPSLGAVPAARYGSCASLGPDGELWISHGFTADSGRFSDTRSYDFTTGSWTDRTPLDLVPVERCLHECFWSNSEQLVLYGGQTTGVAALGDIWAYDFATGTWTRGAEPEAPPRQLYSLAVVPIGGVVLGGGSVDGGFLDDMWFIDPVRLEMSPMDVPGTIPPERSGAALIDGGPRALLFGGKNEDGFLGDLWEFGPI